MTYRYGNVADECNPECRERHPRPKTYLLKIYQYKSSFIIDAMSKAVI